MKLFKWVEWDHVVISALVFAIYLIAVLPHPDNKLIFLSFFWMVPMLVLLLANRYFEANPSKPKEPVEKRPKVRPFRY